MSLKRNKGKQEGFLIKGNSPDQTLVETKLQEQIWFQYLSILIQLVG